MGCHISQCASEYPGEATAAFLGRGLYRPYEKGSDLQAAINAGWHAHYARDVEEDKVVLNDGLQTTRQCRCLIDKLVAALANHDNEALAEGIALAQMLEMSLPEIVDPEED